METLSDKLLIKAYSDAKTNNLNFDFIRLLEDEILRRIVVKLISESKVESISTISSLSIDSNVVNEYFNLA
ncbi:sporulation histidine kinase inhibitor Sda [Rummeliibacillus sp. NPDC094406]|uniref:sporulation histidine kinase inhibitor Sda n=1 Tax=Rummeliibacillus sp. NPDC094406 TaxID=3364511 RepID=UPI0038064BAC